MCKQYLYYDKLLIVSNTVWQSSAADRSQAVDLLIPSNHTTSSNAGSRDLHAVTKARYQKEMREELLSKGAFSFTMSYVLSVLIT